MGHGPPCLLQTIAAGLPQKAAAVGARHLCLGPIADMVAHFWHAEIGVGWLCQTQRDVRASLTAHSPAKEWLGCPANAQSTPRTSGVANATPSVNHVLAISTAHASRRAAPRDSGGRVVGAACVWCPPFPCSPAAQHAAATRPPPLP